MKNLILLFLICICAQFLSAKNIQEQICQLYNEAGKAHYNKQYAKASILDDKLSRLLMFYNISVSFCPKQYQEYGWHARPKIPQDEKNFHRMHK